MPARRFPLRRATVLLALAISGSVAAQSERSMCATANAETILKTSAAAAAAKARLEKEFSRQFEALEPFLAERNQAERMWLQAKQKGAPADELGVLKAAYDKAASAGRDAVRPVEQALQRRQQQELRVLVDRVNVLYKRIGKEQDFKLLLQEGEVEPIYVLDRKAKRSDCKGAVDLTSQIISALDQEEAAKP